MCLIYYFRRRGSFLLTGFLGIWMWDVEVSVLPSVSFVVEGCGFLGMQGPTYPQTLQTLNPKPLNPKPETLKPLP